jgi:hypothetical protein
MGRWRQRRASASQAEDRGFDPHLPFPRKEMGHLDGAALAIPQDAQSKLHDTHASHRSRSCASPGTSSAPAPGRKRMSVRDGATFARSRPPQRGVSDCRPRSPSGSPIVNTRFMVPPRSWGGTVSLPPSKTYLNPTPGTTSSSWPVRISTPRASPWRSHRRMQISGERPSRFSTSGLATVCQASSQLSCDEGRRGHHGEEHGSMASNGMPSLLCEHFESPKVKTTIGPEGLQERPQGRTRNRSVLSL